MEMDGNGWMDGGVYHFGVDLDFPFHLPNECQQFPSTENVLETVLRPWQWRSRCCAELCANANEFRYVRAKSIQAKK